MLTLFLISLQEQGLLLHTDLMIKVDMIISLMEEKALSLYVKAEDIKTFVSEGISNLNLTETKKVSEDFLQNLSLYLSSLSPT